MWSNTSERLLVTFRTPAALSSVTLWNSRRDGPTLLQDEHQLAGMSVATRISATFAVCSISAAIEPPPAGPLPGPYSFRRLTCGASVTSAALFLPNLAAAAPSRPAAVAVAARICVIPAAAAAGPGAPAAAPTPAALWIHAPPGGGGDPTGRPEAA